MINAAQLHGVPYQQAECFGKPYMGSEYLSDNVKSYRLTSDYCVLCGRPATNTHHQPDRHRFQLITPNGTWDLKPALFALCGSGTTGCHGLVEANRYKITWKWYTQANMDAWWNGELLKSQVFPHDPRLYDFGCWVIHDTQTGKETELSR